MIIDTTSIMTTIIDMLVPGNRITMEGLCSLIGDMLDKQVAKNLCRDFMPILEEVIRHDQKEHPSNQHLFNRLVDPQCTANDFNYVLGVLAQCVYDQVENDLNHSIYLGKIAAEALADRSPILEGAWEYAAWLVVKLNRVSCPKEEWTTSNKLNNWIIKVTGDPDLCPNSYLRIEMSTLFLNMDSINGRNQTLAADAFMAAWCSLNTLEVTSYASSCLPGSFFTMNPCQIIRIVKLLNKGGYFADLDLQASLQLEDAISSRLSSILHVSYKYGLHPSENTEPMCYLFMSALLKYIAEYAIQSNSHGCDKSIAATAKAFKLMVTCFENCCKIPRLIHTTFAAFEPVMDHLVEINGKLLENGPEDVCIDTLIWLISSMKTMTAIYKSPVGSELCQYKEGLNLVFEEIEGSLKHWKLLAFALRANVYRLSIV